MGDAAADARARQPPAALDLKRCRMPGMRPAEPERFETTASAPQRANCMRAGDAARHLGIAPKTLANWRSAGKGPRFSRLGRAIVYRVEDLDRFVEACLQD
jgi:hypothetical protein